MNTAFTVKKLKFLLNQLNELMQSAGQSLASEQVFYYADSKSLEYDREKSPGKILRTIRLSEMLFLDEDKADLDQEMLREIGAAFILKFSENAEYYQKLETLFKKLKIEKAFSDWLAELKQFQLVKEERLKKQRLWEVLQQEHQYITYWGMDDYLKIDPQRRDPNVSVRKGQASAYSAALNAKVTAYERHLWRVRTAVAGGAGIGASLGMFTGVIAWMIAFEILHRGGLRSFHLFHC